VTAVRPVAVALVAAAMAALAAGCGLVANGPLVPGVRQCAGLPAAGCEAILWEERKEYPWDDALAYQMTCNLSTCTEAEGSMEVTVLWSTGTQTTDMRIWDGNFPEAFPTPAPPPPVPPTCTGVPEGRCQAAWARAARWIPADQFPTIVRVEVRCSSRECGDRGVGQTIVTLGDGTVWPPELWSYP
jgi:hypothetical protein